MPDIGVLLKRLNQLEAKVFEHEEMVSLVNEHDLKIERSNSQQEEINQLKKKVSDLEEKTTNWPY